MDFMCFYCTYSSKEFQQTVQHHLDEHTTEELKIRQLDNNTSKIVNYKIIPDLCREQGRVISIDNVHNKIHVSRTNMCVKDSPTKKVPKANKTVETPHEKCNLSEPPTENEPFITSDNFENEDSVLQELVHMLPTVLRTLRECDKLDEYMSFNRLLSKNKFPLHNIAFLLFMDVVRWYSLDTPTTFMRYRSYSPEVKLFWRTGMTLFRGRFLRFMGGPKNRGQVIEEKVRQGHFTPGSSKVNFIAPDRRVLKDAEPMVSESNPGVLHKMINVIAEKENQQLLTYKLCVDGKKINPSSKGEVNLWGFEEEPTFKMKEIRLQEELDYIAESLDLMKRQIEFGHVFIEDILNYRKIVIATTCRRAITILTHRIKDLRMLKVKRQSAMIKLQLQCPDDWRNSKYVMVISGIRTHLYQIDITIEDNLSAIEKLCEFSAAAMGIFTTQSSSEVYLQNQDRYVCLGGHDNATDTSVVKQRTPQWFDIREKSLVTGSTINRAIGLEGLKSQKEYLQVKSGCKVPEPISTATQAMFAHGTDNELNAVATLVSTFIPAFEPNGVVYEEGCYVKAQEDNISLVVSPDGSVRQSGEEDRKLSAVEIKCPLPGKTYTTPIHYTIPKYYVTQILSEMDCLGVDNIYFASYGMESMTIQQAIFDNDLWSDICEEIQCLDINQIPKRVKTSVSNLTQKIKQYCKTNVTLIAEVKSKTAKACVHTGDKHGRIYHNKEARTDKHIKIEIKNVQKTLMRVREIISRCYALQAQKASEVLVFLLADLDRQYHPELPHAYPIAYALKGYSMKAEAMRKMIAEVLQVLFLKGLYTPALSFDGQWAVLTYRANDGTPLTLMELQRQVYNNVKSRRKSDLIKAIFDTAVVHSDNFETVIEQLHYSVDEETHAVTVATKFGTRCYQPSAHCTRLIGSTDPMAKKPVECGTENIGDIGDLLAGVSSDVIARLDENDIDFITKINSADVIMEINSTDLRPTECTQPSVIDEPDWSMCMFESDSNGIAQMGELENIQAGSNGYGINEEKREEHSSLLPLEKCNTEPVNNVGQQAEDKQPLLNECEIQLMFDCLQNSEKCKRKWITKTFDDFKCILNTIKGITSVMTKFELSICLESSRTQLSKANIKYCKSWSKVKIAELLYTVCSGKCGEPFVRRQSRRQNPPKLTILCKRVINKIPKYALNAVVAEHEMGECVKQWKEGSPFTFPTTIDGIDHEITWFSKPEYNTDTLAYTFCFLDIHHLITNCRIKVCKDGFPARNISKSAWVAVARENKTNLKVLHVEDFIDKQSDAIARETFSLDVETRMRMLGYIPESNFCKMIREFYEAEDEPGLRALQRCQCRLELRNWLLNGVNFCRFPPYGSHVDDVPNIMFQGFLTNIDRRMQIFPYVKSGNYNVRSLGSLEAENLFGEFQDLDPKGSGIVKAEEVPSALESACQLLKTRLNPDRPFHMALSKAKVYPTHSLLEAEPNEHQQIFIYPSLTNHIVIRDHTFDSKIRAKRKASRRVVAIKPPDEAARGVAPVRQFHKCDESKILPHKRLGINV